MRVGQQPLGHAHRQERNPALLDQSADRVVCLRVCRAFAEDDQRALGAVEDIERALDGGWSRDLGRRGIDDLDQRPRSGIGIHDLREQFGRQIEINTAWTPGESRADRACHANADICGMQHAKRRLAQRPGNRKLVHLLVVALLQVDDLAFGRAADQDHRKAVGRGIGQRSQTVEKSGSRDREADAGLLRQEAGDGGGIAGMLLVPEREDAHACRLRLAPQVGDRDARHAIDRVDAVELERIDDEVKTIGELRLRFIRRRGHGLRLGCCIRHDRLPTLERAGFAPAQRRLFNQSK